MSALNWILQRAGSPAKLHAVNSLYNVYFCYYTAILVLYFSVVCHLFLTVRVCVCIYVVTHLVEKKKIFGSSVWAWHEIKHVIGRLGEASSKLFLPVCGLLRPSTPRSNIFTSKLQREIKLVLLIAASILSLDSLRLLALDILIATYTCITSRLNIIAVSSCTVM